MKLSKETLKQIIKEELEAALEEGFASDEPQQGYDFTPEQKKVMKDVIEILNKMPSVSYDRMKHTLRYMKYEHPAFKGSFAGEPLDIQTQMGFMGLNKKHMISTTAMP